MKISMSILQILKAYGKFLVSEMQRIATKVQAIRLISLKSRGSKYFNCLLLFLHLLLINLKIRVNLIYSENRC